MEPATPDHYVEPSLVPHTGPEVKLGGRLYVLAPLPMFTASRLIPEVTRAQVTLAGAANGEPAKLMDLFAEATKLGVSAIHASLKRNYPALTLETVGDELIDQDNYGPVLAAVLNRSQSPAGESVATEKEGSPLPPSPVES